MASKFGLAGGLPERRVRPIWDAIDSRQFKNALKAVKTLLSKYLNAPYALIHSPTTAARNPSESISLLNLFHALQISSPRKRILQKKKKKKKMYRSVSWN
uniref:Uncharacterized protein n=1 Tax=Cucumis sativus TaxID=3659 RepID=A0A0A0KPY7_CUCSA